MAILEPHPGRGASGNPRRVAECADQRLAGVPNARLSFMGAQRLLSIGWCFRFPRSVAGCHGADSYRTAACARAIVTQCGASICGGRCPALVASAFESRGAYPLFRRLSVVAAGGLPLCAEHGRYRRVGSICIFPRRAASQPRGRLLLRPTGPIERDGQLVSALCARHSPWLTLWRTRLAPDRLRRLE